MAAIISKIYEIFPIALFLAAPLIITGLGGLYSERSGIVNVALDASMQIGAFTCVVVLIALTEKGVNNAVWYSMALGIIASTVFMGIHAFASINMMANQTISGTALNVLAGGLTIYLCTILYGAKSTPSFSVSSTLQKMSVPLLKDIPVIGQLFFTNNYPFTYLAYVLAFVTWFIIYKTPFGLRLRSCGEFPQASASMGINVAKTRWIAVLTSGALSGLGGIALVLTTQTFFNDVSIHSMGFIAIATLIFGKWNPWGVFGAGILFGFSEALVYYSNLIPFLTKVPTEFINAFPYILTIIVIVLNGKQIGPKASGEIYDPSKR